MSAAPRDLVPFAVTLRTPQGPVAGRIAIDPGPMRLGELVPFAQGITSMYAAKANAAEAQLGHATSCGPGCGACCRQLVPLSAPEAFALSDLVASLPPERRAVVLQRFERLVAEVGARAESAAVAGLRFDEPRPERIAEVARQYFELGLPCPFLEEESCSIHPQRPCACRDYNVTTPPEWCAAPERHPIRKVPMPAGLSGPLARLATEKLGIAPELVVLPHALAWVEEHAALGARAWPGVELFQAFLAAIDAAPPS
ncbi:MAG: YkgJ family cysteine cluster protein [Deltaproteobacteria bacterium]|nr:YkgJ family cysteine cluster protein [Deltaproteobacteria bacterium]